MSTRPRIEFDHRGWCNACQWMEEKTTLDWAKREQEMRTFLEQHRNQDGGFNCLVPVSGGKDGSYVAHTMKTDFGVNPLAVTVRPALSLELGDQNLLNFINSGFDHIHITPNNRVLQQLNKLGFIEKGFPYYGWLIAILSACVNTAAKLGIPLIMYGEDGEVEYGGDSSSRYRAFYDVSYMKKVYLEGGYDKVLSRVQAKEDELYFWRFPSDEELAKKKIHIAHMSYFRPWDSYKNYLVAKEHCGLKENEDTNQGTFTNFAQNDQALYALHTYMMYLKFGFGRATQDAGIEIRRGAMTRDQAVQLVRLYDNQYPEQFVPLYLDYYEMKQAEFDAVLDKWVNQELFKKIDGRWEPKFIVE